MSLIWSRQVAQWAKGNRLSVALALVLLGVLVLFVLTLLTVFHAQGKSALLQVSKSTGTAHPSIHDSEPAPRLKVVGSDSDLDAPWKGAAESQGAKKDVPKEKPSSQTKPAESTSSPRKPRRLEDDIPKDPSVKKPADSSKKTAPVRRASSVSAPVERFDAELRDTCMKAFAKPLALPVIIAKVVPEDSESSDYFPYLISFPLHWVHLESHRDNAVRTGSLVWYTELEHKQDLVRDFTEEGDLVVDIGSGAGFSALAMAAAGRRVLVVEAMEENAEKIQQSVVANGWTAEDVRVIHAAATAVPGPVDLFCPVGRGDNCALSEEAALTYLSGLETEVAEVPGVTVDQLFADARKKGMATGFAPEDVRMMIITTSGSEGDVLEGAMTTLQKADRILVLVNFDGTKMGKHHGAIDASPAVQSIEKILDFGYTLHDQSMEPLEIADLDSITDMHSYFIILKKGI